MATLSPSQVTLIKSSVPILQQHGNTITTLFYHNLLVSNPDLNNVFNQANQANNHQAQALAGSLLAYATHINDLGILSPAVEKICAKHASLYITPEQYDVVGAFLLQAMGTVLGDALTAEMLDAWGAAYWQLANIMIAREKDILAGAGGWTQWRDVRITGKVKESEEITSFRFAPVDGKGLASYLPGQYVSVMMDVPGLGYAQSRQYSLSDSPARAVELGYRISVKRERGLEQKAEDQGVKKEKHPGYLSNVLHDDKEVGDVVRLSHPQGVFFLDPAENKDSPVVLISAGVGLTPMISMLNTLIMEKQTARKISWVHATRNSAVQAFGPHVMDLADKNENIRRVVFNKNPAPTDKSGREYTHTGRMNLDALDDEKDLFLNDAGTEYYICGPERFVSDMAKWLKNKKVDNARVKLELFGTGEIPS